MMKGRHKIKLMVGIPTLGKLSMATYSSLPNLRKKGLEIELHFNSQTPLDRARNTIIQRFLDSKNTHLLFIDSDVMIPSNISSLLKRDVDVVAGLYGLWLDMKPVWNIFEKTLEKGLYRAINRFKKRELLEIDGCGLGCLLIKRRVLEKLTKPWCSFSSWDGETKRMNYAEDFSLCEKIKRAGFKIHADTSVVCGHVVKADIIEITNYIGSKVARELLLQEMIEYTGLEKKEIDNLMKYSMDKIANEWKEINPKTESEITDFYRNVQWYIYDLAEYNCNPACMVRREEIASKASGRILDYGAGIGTHLIDVHERGKKGLNYVDLRGKTWDFAEWRFKQRDMKVKMMEPDELEGKYDTILLLDILEHIPKWKRVLKMLVKQHLNEKGTLFITDTFLDKENDIREKAYPQHSKLGRGELRKYLDKLLKGRKVIYYLWEKPKEE